MTLRAKAKLIEPIVSTYGVVFLGILVACLTPISKSVAAESCQEAQIYEAGWQMDKKELAAMTKNAAFADNKKLFYLEKVGRVAEHMKSVRGTLAPGKISLDDQELAEKIVQVATCTGNDFTILAALLANESKYCRDRHNKKGGDSGCGQFTGDAITEIKNQMRLPGRNSIGSDAGLEGFEKLLNRCYFKRPEGKAHFKELFSRSESKIKSVLRKGKDVETDLIATGIYLKFMYGLAASTYYSAGSKAKGALSRYNGGGTKGYGKTVNNSAKKIDACVEDTQQLQELSEAACSMSSDAEACNLVSPTQSDI